VYVVYYYYTFRKEHQADWSSCAMKAINDVYKPFFKAEKDIADNMVNQLVAGGALKSTIVQTNFLYTIPKVGAVKAVHSSGTDQNLNAQTPQVNLSTLRLNTAPGGIPGTGALPVTGTVNGSGGILDGVDLSNPKSPASATNTGGGLVSVPNPDGTVSVTNQSTGEVVTYNADGSVKSVGQTKEKTSISPVVVGGAALAALFLIAPAFKKDKGPGALGVPKGAPRRKHTTRTPRAKR
jgi:hypothetical protein